MGVYNLLDDCRELFEVLVEQSLNPVFILQDERFLYFNKSVENITGYSSEELCVIDPFKLVHPEDREEVYRKYLLRVNGLRDNEIYSFRVLAKDGKTKWITVKAFGVNYRGKPAVVVSAMETTLLNELNEELKKRNELLSHLSSMLRHDILNDLAIISAAIELRDDELLDRASERISKIEEKISDVRRLEEEMGELKIINISDMASSVIEKYKKDAKINLTSENLFVKADESLKSAIENIVGNAIIHNPTPVEIEVEIFKEGEECVIKISDNGVGISDELKEKIFKERVSTRKGGGLGLIITKKIIDIFGGSIRVYDNVPKGAVFEFRVPCIP
ncbi:MAG: PAS domain-containing sensor histidine kinase [Archaeoglobaceae archaeon]